MVLAPRYALFCKGDAVILTRKKNIARRVQVEVLSLQAAVWWIDYGAPAAAAVARQYFGRKGGN